MRTNDSIILSISSFVCFVFLFWLFLLACLVFSSYSDQWESYFSILRKRLFNNPGFRVITMRTYHSGTCTTLLCTCDESNMLILHHTNIFYAETNHLAVKDKALFDLVSQKEKKNKTKRSQRIIKRKENTNGNVKWKQPNCLKRWETRATKSWLV